ncbi:DnaB-like helicase N-terminal domain-containing protein [Embleya sp. NPDC020630]|uniref:DnaB-like helicase N-terminal domain-containing protein n=1 Tax=Embleya sp. NPDC020630 TaxID=3363979 RepID=UPI0037939D03
MHPHLYAEQALLGALLLEPTRVEEVRGRLLPEHMYRPAHTALYRALLEHPAPPDATATMATRVLALVAAAGEHAAGITPVYAHTLMAACPYPRNAVLYARMIVEAADHRTIAQHATRLGQVAVADQARDGLADTLTHHQALHAALDELAHRWGEPHGTTPPAPVVLPPTTPCPRDLTEEQALIAALVADPTPLSRIGHWLRPDDFADHAHRALYQSIAGLAHRGETIDPLTVLWEAQRRGHLADGTLTPELTLTITAYGTGGSTDYHARRVLRAALLRTAAATAHTARTHANNPTLPIRHLLAVTRLAMGPLDEIRRRWHTALGEPTYSTRGETVGPVNDATVGAARSRTTAFRAPGMSEPTPERAANVPARRAAPNPPTSFR